MATLEENMVKHLLGDDNIASRVSARVIYNSIPNPVGDYIWFTLSATEDEYCLDDAPGAPFRYFYDVECYSENPFRATELGRFVQARLNKVPKGTFGAGTVQGVFAENQDADYVAKGDGSDGAFHGAFIRAEVIP